MQTYPLLNEQHAMKMYWGVGSGGITSCILNLGNRWRSVFSFMPHLLHPQARPPHYPL